MSVPAYSYAANNPVQYVDPNGITLASSICTTGPFVPIQRHEEQHILQRQAVDVLPGPLSELYFPLHIVAQAYSYWTTGDYSTANPLESGPYSDPPRPWP
jgi:hypothetical protein